MEYMSSTVHGGNINNHYARQFTSACKQLPVHNKYIQIKYDGLGNLYSLSDIPVLSYSSFFKNPINNSDVSIYKDINLITETHSIEKQAMHLTLSSFTKGVTVLIIGFVSLKYPMLIKFDVFIAVLFG